MKNCVRLDNYFDLSLVNIKDVKFHRTFSRRQPYNRALEEKYEAIPTSTYVLPEDVTSHLLTQLPQEVLDVEVPQIYILTMEASDAPHPVLAAHVDLNRSCGINIYIETNGEITHFYDWDKSTKTLSEIERFVANTDECWLMDTQIPHSVSLVTGKQRSMLTFSFVKTPYYVIKNGMRKHCDGT